MTKNANELVNWFCELCETEGLCPDRAGIRRVFERYSSEEIERFIDACLRFGVISILKAI